MKAKNVKYLHKNDGKTSRHSFFNENLIPKNVTQHREAFRLPPLKQNKPKIQSNLQTFEEFIEYENREKIFT